MAENDKDLALVNNANKAVAKFQAVADQIEIISGGTVEGKDAMLLSSMFFSGYFKDIESLSKAVVRVAFGKRIGVDVATAVTSLYIIDGKPALEAQAIRNTAVMGGYEIITKQLDDEKCVLEWHFKGQRLGESSFSVVDAKRMGFVDPECDKYPAEHNVRTVKTYNKWEKRWEEKQDCKCKDNWKKVPQDMLLARATTKGARAYGNRAFKQEVYDVEELTDSNIRTDTTPIDIGRARIQKATTLDELQAITKDLEPNELQELLSEISDKTKELLNEGKQKADTGSGGSSSEK